MTKDDAKITYVGDDPSLKSIFAGEFYVMDYKIDRQGPVTNDALFDRWEVGPAHVYPDGRVMRYRRVIGHVGREFKIGD